MRKFHAGTGERLIFIPPGIVAIACTLSTRHEVRTTTFAALQEQEAFKNAVNGNLIILTLPFKLNEFPGLDFSSIEVSPKDVHFCQATYYSWCDLDSIPEIWDFLLRRNGLTWLV